MIASNKNLDKLSRKEGKIYPHSAIISCISKMKEKLSSSLSPDILGLLVLSPASSATREETHVYDWHRLWHRIGAGSSGGLPRRARGRLGGPSLRARGHRPAPARLRSAASPGLGVARPCRLSGGLSAGRARSTASERHSRQHR